MENIILKNQKQLYNNLPIAQLGTRFTKLGNRFASKTNYPINIKLPTKQQTNFINLNNQNINPTKNKHNRVQSSLQGSQLQYFKQINTQIKQQNQNLKQDLKICNQKLYKVLQQKKKSDQKVLLCHKTINKSQKKINSLMELAHHLIIMVKDKFFTGNTIKKIQNQQSNNQSEQQNSKRYISPLQMKKLSMQKQIQKIKKLTIINQRNESNRKKKTIQSMVDEYKDSQQKNKNERTVKKSTFFQQSNQVSQNDQKSINFTDNQVHQQQRQTSQQNNMNQLMNSLQSFEKDVKQLKVLQKLMQGITHTFNQQTHFDNSFLFNKQLQTDQNTLNKNYVLSQLGTFFTGLIQKQQIQMHQSCKIHQCVINEKIKPTYTSYRLYSSIKQIFDHQIYLLQNQKMLFLQYKNKRLLKFIYQCSGCQRYQQMFNEIFRILRQGFKQIKVKIIPQLKHKQQDDLDILL